MLYAYPLDLLSWKTRRQRRHVCAIFQARCAIFLPVDPQVLSFLHFAVKIDIYDGLIDPLWGGQTCFLMVFHAIF